MPGPKALAPAGLTAPLGSTKGSATAGPGLASLERANADRPCPSPSAGGTAYGVGVNCRVVEVDAHLTTLGLAPGDFAARARPRSTSLRWPARGSGRDGAVLRFGMLGGVGHQYPNGANNPAGFSAAPEFWSYFRAHALP